MEVDAVNQSIMVGGADDRNAVFLQPRRPSIDLAAILGLERDMIEDFVGGMRDFRARREAGSLEEGDRRAVAHLEEYVKIREIIPGGRHAVIEDRAHEFHAHDARIEIGGGLHVRSDEHTSELQSLMRTSYAV